MISQLRKNIFSGSIAAAGSIIISIVAYPVYLHFLGAELYGLWAILSVLIYFSSIGNFGIDEALIKYISEKYQKKDIKAVVRYISTGLNLLIVNGIILYIVCILLSDFFASVLNLRSADIIMYRQLFRYVVMLSIFILIVNFINAVLKGLGRFDQASYILLAGRSIGLVTAVLFFMNGYRIWGIYLGQLFSFLTVFSLSSYFILKQIGLYYKPFAYKKDYLVNLLKFGGTMTVSRILSMLLEPFIKIVIARYIGLAEVAYFEVANKIVLQIRSLFERGISAIMPEVSRLTAVLNDSGKKIIRVMKNANRINFFISTLVFFSLILFCKPILELWLGSEYHIAIVSALRIILLGYLVNLFSVPSYYYFMGKGLIGFCFLNHLIQAVLNFVIITLLIILGYINFHFMVASYAFSLAFSATVLILIYYCTVRKDRRKNSAVGVSDKVVQGV
jgi:O-antigen/teichoic acid export membrane protein